MNAGLLKVCLGVGSPWDLRPFMERLGVEVIPFAQRNRCSVFADFVGARPPIDRLLTIFRPGHEKGQGDLVTDSAEAAAGALYSKALGLDLFITATPEMFNVLCSVSALRAGRAAVCLRGENGTGRRFLASILHAASGLSSSASGKINTFYPATDAGAPILDALVAASRYGTLVVYEPEKLRRQAQHQIAKIIESDDAALPRIICVTSAGVDDLADDLRWTLNNAVFDIQPLRLRRNDISLLSGHFLRTPLRSLSRMYSREIFGSLRRSLQGLRPIRRPARRRKA